MTEEQVIALEEYAARLRAHKEQIESWSSPSGIGDVVSGIQVVGPDGVTKQEWHNERNS